MAGVSRLTPRPSPAHQPRTASTAPPRALADGRDGPERPDHEAHLVDCADRAAEQLPPESRHPLDDRSCSRCSSGWCAAAPPAAPQRPCPHSYSSCTIGVPLPGYRRASCAEPRCPLLVALSDRVATHSAIACLGLPPVRPPHGRRLLAAACPGQTAPHCPGQCGRAEATLSFRFRLANGNASAISRIAISRVIAFRALCFESGLYRLYVFACGASCGVQLR